MRLRWTPAAASDLEQISDYLRNHHPTYWRATVLRLYEGVRSLKSFPESGRPGNEPGTRELVFQPLPYIAVYRVKQDAVEILRIYHAARNR